mmetsp:Transcript_21983/g.70809  ORF Transcript_21983/g.70809 Transcript_21983/m.70809 type:complete len:151 (-) Transcript_21983:431-883(-)
MGPTEETTLSPGCLSSQQRNKQNKQTLFFEESGGRRHEEDSSMAILFLLSHLLLLRVSANFVTEVTNLPTYVTPSPSGAPTLTLAPSVAPSSAPTTFAKELQKLTASDAAAGDSFGFSVAISGTVAVVGAYLDDNAGFFSGSAYVYDVGA